MSVSEAIEFLRQHQPMPGDDVITELQAGQFIAALRLLESRPTQEAIPLLLGSVSPNTGLGMYEHIGFVLRRFHPELVAPHLARLLNHSSAEVRCRAAWWCSDCPDESLSTPLLERLRREEDPGVCYAVRAALEARGPREP
jgi:hypothetical protein